jgi:hypothetical protein
LVFTRRTSLSVIGTCFLRNDVEGERESIAFPELGDVDLLVISSGLSGLLQKLLDVDDGVDETDTGESGGFETQLPSELSDEDDPLECDRGPVLNDPNSICVHRTGQIPPWM